MEHGMIGGVDRLRKMDEAGSTHIGSEGGSGVDSALGVLGKLSVGEGRALAAMACG